MGANYQDMWGYTIMQAPVVPTLTPPLVASKPGSGNGGGGDYDRAKGAMVRRDAAYTWAAANIEIPFDVEELDQDDYWDVGQPTRLTAPQDGWYIVTGFAHWQSFGTSSVVKRISLLLNGVSGKNSAASSRRNDDDKRQSVGAVFYLTEGEYVELRAYHNSGTNGIQKARFAMVRVLGDTTIGVASGAMVERAATQGINNSTSTAVQWDTEVRDDDDYWSVGQPTRLTVPIDGWYIVCATIYWDSNGTGRRIVDFRVNGVTWHSAHSNDAEAKAHVNVTHLFYLSANDYIEVIVWQNSGGALDITDALAQITLVRY